MSSEPIDLTMDAFCPVEPPLRPRMNSGPAPKEDTMAQELAGISAALRELQERGRWNR